MMDDCNIKVLEPTPALASDSLEEWRTAIADMP